MHKLGPSYDLMITKLITGEGGATEVRTVLERNQAYIRTSNNQLTTTEIGAKSGLTLSPWDLKLCNIDNNRQTIAWYNCQWKQT